MTDTAVYVYCIVKAVARPSTRRVPPGIPRAALPAVAGLGGGLWLIVAEVPLDTYGPGRLDAALQDMRWIGNVALAHEAVVEHYARAKGVTVIPAKLFTMFSTLDRAVADMRARRRDISHAARRIAGCEEWGVRIVRAAAGAAKRAQVQAPATGSAFLAAKKRARDEEIESARAAAEAALAAFDSLSEIARDARRRDDVPDEAVTLPLLEAAFLVPTGSRGPFKTAARRAATGCARTGASMTLTGPWPAYNFIHPPEGTR
jgi:Gas vesicle synthesis protein GvpL/GvpF